MNVADTSFLVALLDGADANHAASRATLKATDRLVVPMEILVETQGVLVAKAGRDAAHGAVAALRALPHLEWAGATDPAAVFALAGEDSRLSLPDVIAVHHAQARGCGLLTHDRRQAAVAAALAGGGTA